MSKHTTDPTHVVMDLPSELWHWLETLRVRSRKDCRNGPRPCPCITCEHHLLFSTDSSQPTDWRVKSIEIQEMEFTCALDQAERSNGSLSVTTLESKPLPPPQTCSQVIVELPGAPTR